MKILKILILFFSISAFCQEKNNDNLIYTSASIEIQPEYEGGLSAFMEYVSKNFILTPEAIKNKISGRIIISFVIEKDGSLTEIKLVRGLGYGLDQEAIRVLKACKNWRPGELNGKKIRVHYQLPLVVDVK